jgi:hypothetical protein
MVNSIAGQANKLSYSREISQTINKVQKEPEKELTVLFYMNGQFDELTDKVANSMFGLERAGSSKNINLVAQLGKLPGKKEEVEFKDKAYGEINIPIDHNWGGVKRYEIRQDAHSNLDEKFRSKILDDFIKVEKEIPNNPVLKNVIAFLYNRRDGYVTTYKEDGTPHLAFGENALSYIREATKLGFDDIIANPDSEKSRRIIKEFDGHTKAIYESADIYKVFKSNMVEDLGDKIQMSHPAQLRNFISWGMEKYPAKKYMLVVMDHGRAWQGIETMTPKEIAESVQNGVSDANNKTKRNDRFGEIVFNSCYMANAEAALEMKDLSDISVVSENFASTSIFADWQYLLKNLQDDIEKDKSFNPEKFAVNMVEFYRKKNEILNTQVDKNDPSRTLKTYSTLTP